MPKKDCISYNRSEVAWADYVPFLQELAKRPNIKKICEIGAGATPSLSLDFVREHKLEYTLLDISAEELKKAPDGYRKIVGDIIHPHNLLEANQYDLIFSRMLAEHVKNGKVFHQNVFQLLAPHGIAFHFFPTLCAAPFMVNKFLSEKVSTKVLNLLNKRKKFEPGTQLAKFPAYYSYCYGPTKQQMSALTEIGYSIEQYIGFFGHGYYDRIPVLKQLNKATTKLLMAYPSPWLTSYAYVLLYKPPALLDT